MSKKDKKKKNLMSESGKGQHGFGTEKEPKGKNNIAAKA